MDIYQNGTQYKSGFRNSFSTEPLWNQSLKILESYFPPLRSVFVWTGVKSELCSAYHKEWYLKFCQKSMFTFSSSFSSPNAWLNHISLYCLHKVYNVTSCCLYIHIIMTTVRYSWFWLAAQEVKVTERNWAWRFEINYRRNCGLKSFEIIFPSVVPWFLLLKMNTRVQIFSALL